MEVKDRDSRPMEGEASDSDHIVVRASDCDPIVVRGFKIPPTVYPQGTLDREKVVAVGYHPIKTMDHDEPIVDVFADTIGDCMGFKGQITSSSYLINGCLLLNFWNKEDGKRAEEIYDGKKILGYKVQVHDFVQNGEIYDRCEVANGRLYFHARVDASRGGTAEHRVHDFGVIRQQNPAA